MKKISFFLGLLYIISFSSLGQFTIDDTLRGSITPERSWWDLKYYHLDIEVNIDSKFITGKNLIKFVALNSGNKLQIDLQRPLSITKIEFEGKNIDYLTKGNNAHIIILPRTIKTGELSEIIVWYEGNPQEAKRAPWDGGFSWSKDENEKPFVATSCQGLGASVWWPCKDHMYDEPDSMRITVAVPNHVMNISNGRLEKDYINDKNQRVTQWVVKNPINNYGVNINIGDYIHFSEVYNGEKGPLTCDYYVLRNNLDKAQKQFKDVGRMLKAFEHWFGPYPFYNDGYKLVEVPYLGMEHQSSITYGNKYKNGYLGRDLSGTGWGSKWDFIIIHESGHEWFANNITYIDIADMWIHESFTNYSETLFTEYHYGLKAGQDYVIGSQANISNVSPIVGKYNLNQAGSGDMYAKGGNMLHTIRHIIKDDEKFRMILRGMNIDFYHQTVSGSQIENYISSKSGIDFSRVFDQYLRDVRIPVLKVVKTKKKLKYNWEQVVTGFDMPIMVKIDGAEKWLKPEQTPKVIKGKNIEVDRNFYIKLSVK
jgi:aminopeptidase N